MQIIMTALDRYWKIKIHLFHNWEQALQFLEARFWDAEARRLSLACWKIKSIQRQESTCILLKRNHTAFLTQYGIYIYCTHVFFSKTSNCIHPKIGLFSFDTFWKTEIELTGEWLLNIQTLMPHSHLLSMF